MYLSSPIHRPDYMSRTSNDDCVAHPVVISTSTSSDTSEEQKCLTSVSIRPERESFPSKYVWCDCACCICHPEIQSQSYAHSHLLGNGIFFSICREIKLQFCSCRTQTSFNRFVSLFLEWTSHGRYTSLGYRSSILNGPARDYTQHLHSRSVKFAE